jgi:hypothetical protein
MMRGHPVPSFDATPAIARKLVSALINCPP